MPAFQRAHGHHRGHATGLASVVSCAIAARTESLRPVIVELGGSAPCRVGFRLDGRGTGHFWWSARANSARPIFERPGRSRCLAISYSSARVFGVDAPTRLRCATAAACLPRAVLLALGMCAIDRLLRAPACALVMLRWAAVRCFVLAIAGVYPGVRRCTPCQGVHRVESTPASNCVSRTRCSPRSARTPSPNGPPANWTPRDHPRPHQDGQEAQIVRLVRDGLPNAEVAAADRHEGALASRGAAAHVRPRTGGTHS
jgi:hypothetical protein